MKNHYITYDMNESRQMNGSIFKKLCTSMFIILFFMLGFQTETKAESYDVIRVEENYYELQYSGLNIGWWPHYTRLQVFTTATTPGPTYDAQVTVYDGGTHTMRVYYKGNSGVNKVYTTAIVYLAAYGPFYRDQFIAPKLKAPTEFTATTDELNQISLNWKNNTNYAVADVEYHVYRGGTKIATVAGNLHSYVVGGLANGESQTYSVHTVLKGTNRVSNKAYATGRAFAFDLTASTDKVNKVVLNWNTTDHLPGGYTLSRNDGIDNVIIKADIPDHQGSLPDDDGLLPGVYMTYKIVANDYASHFSETAGRSRPNGKISGSVTTPYGDPIGGVTIKIERENLPEDTVQKRRSRFYHHSPVRRTYV